jgi:hypothetical protein
MKIGNVSAVSTMADPDSEHRICRNHRITLSAPRMLFISSYSTSRTTSRGDVVYTRL